MIHSPLHHENLPGLGVPQEKDGEETMEENTVLWCWIKSPWHCPMQSPGEVAIAETLGGFECRRDPCPLPDTVPVHPLP